MSTPGPNPALPTLKQRALRALNRRQVIYQGGHIAFAVYSEADENDIIQYLRAPETI